MRRKMRIGFRARELTDIPLTPLIDTALTLLIIFIVATPMMHNAIKVSLPKGNSKEDAGGRQDFVVYLDKDNQIFFNGKKCSYVDLVNQVKQTAPQSKDRIIIVKADEAIPYGRVIELVDQLKIVGMKHVVLAMQKRI
jgi:biopolymer transport protein TolR